jgi:hypothetical protein
MNRSLYIGDLSHFVTEEALRKHIRQFCPVKSVRLCLHPETQAFMMTTAVSACKKKFFYELHKNRR